MKLDPKSASPEAYPAPAPEDWTWEVHAASSGARGTQYTAAVCRRGVVLCRISLTSPADREEARTALAIKARLWIQDYLQRNPPAGGAGGAF